MSVLSTATIAKLLEPFLPADPTHIPPNFYAQLSDYLDLLVAWNARTNLTAVRDPQEMVIRHFGESLLLGGLLPPASRTLLDLGSGAGFPGLPIQLLYPQLTVTLAESKAKKAAFLREAVRVLGVRTGVLQRHLSQNECEVYDVVALRAVDRMDLALPIAAAVGKQILLLTTRAERNKSDLDVRQEIAVPGARDRVAALCVPRGTEA